MKRRQPMYTISGWAKRLRVTVLDADGFDRSDHKLHRRRFTRAQFLDRLAHCTVQWGGDCKVPYLRGTAGVRGFGKKIKKNA